MTRFPLKIPFGKNTILVLYPAHIFFLITVIAWFILVLYSLFQ